MIERKVRRKASGGTSEVRLSGLRRLMERKKLDCLLVSCMENIRYLTGFTGSAAAVVVTPDKAYFLTDGRYITQAREQVKGFRTRRYKTLTEELAALINSLSVTRLGVEAEHLTHAFFKALKGLLNVSRVLSTNGMVEELRAVKDQGELNSLRGAADIVVEAFEDVMKDIRPGMTEWEVGVELEHRFKLLGSEKNSFDFIVASGKRGSLPHGIATHKKIKKGEMVTIDCGTRWDGYYSDCTRTCAVGKATRRQREVYQVVLDAQRKAIETVRPGIKTGRVDAAAREHISEKGYGKYFSHSTGHGIGLAVHEGPAVARGTGLVLKPGMVITVEPGIYIPDWGGVRIEDMVVVGEEGAEVITEGVDKDFLVV